MTHAEKPCSLTSKVRSASVERLWNRFLEPVSLEATARAKTTFIVLPPTTMIGSSLQLTAQYHGEQDS